MKYIILVLCVAFGCLQSTFADGFTDAKIINANQSVVVKLFGAGIGNLDSYGSGVLVSPEGHVATVWNHLVNTGYLSAVTADGRRFETEVVGTSVDHDLAVLKLTPVEEGDTFDCLDLNVPSRKDLRAGENVLAFSNMFRVAVGREPVSVVHGILAGESVLNAGLGRWNFPVQTPVYILDAVTNNSGAAGGLLTDYAGRPAGLLGREIRHRGTNMWVNYAVPWKSLQPVIQKLIAGERIESQAIEQQNTRDRVSERQLTSKFGMTLLPSVIGRTPAYIDRILAGSVADKAGLKRGDLVVLVNGSVVKSVEDFRHLLTTFRRGQRISIAVNRNDELITVSLRMPRK